MEICTPNSTKHRYQSVQNKSQPKPMNVLNYIAMCFILIIRDLFYPPKEIFNELPLKHGYKILDYGCGPGSYSIAAAELLEGTGMVYALDLHPFAIEDVRQAVKKRKLSNIQTISSNCETGLPSNSVDIILLHYVFNDLKNPDPILSELHRILKPQGILSFSEFNLEKISPKVSKNGLFQVTIKGRKIHSFVKVS
jgi:ubiquinone/menaquinone biosynthesis C-methylase UbiE